MMIAKSGRDWQPPAIDSLFRRKEDGTIWRVANIYRQDRQLKLVRTDDARRVKFVFARDLGGYESVV